MSLNDPIADFLTQVRNAAHAGHDSVSIRHSKMKESIARILMNEGYVRNVDVVGEGVRKQVVVELKYTASRKPVFHSMDRVSKGGRRVYVSQKEIKPTRQGVGVAILSTPKGVMTDTDAKRQGVGGEILCTVW
jgi:small subunit ribosomal protein S8